MINGKKIVAVMPIKLNSERLPGKNLKLLGNMPLLRHQLDMLSELEELDGIYVYCSDLEIVDYLPEKAEFLQRDKKLDLPSANFSEIFEAFSREIDSDIYVYAHATAPYIKKETARECIHKVVFEDYDSAFCAVKIQDFLWKDNKPLNFSAEKIPRSQDLDVIWRETSGIYVFEKEVFIKMHRRIGDRPYIKNVAFKESIDINTPEDFWVAKMFYEER